jgi:hypothetical protein
MFGGRSSVWRVWVHVAAKDGARGQKRPIGRLWHADQRPIDVMFTWSEGESPGALTYLCTYPDYAPNAAVHHLRASFRQFISSGNTGMTLIQSLQFQ